MARRQWTPRQAAVDLIEKLRAAGYTAYLAGGCVRDALMGYAPKDYDVATDARPEQVRAVLPKSKYVGEAFGVVLAYRGGQAIEVATFRREWGYADGRRPDEVAFTDAQHDAARRDFTINGLFADPLDRDPATGGDRIIDYVGGRADIDNRLIRAIGDPSERFGEDYLRMMRAIRFAARLGFELESRTAAAIVPLAKYLGQISRERIGQELQWMLTGPAPARAATLIQNHRLDGPVLGEDHADPPLSTLTALAAATSEPKAARQDDTGTNEALSTAADNSEAADYALMLAGWMVDRHVVGAKASGTDSGDAGERLAALARFAAGEAEAAIQRWRKALCLSNEARDRLRGTLTLAGEATGWDQLATAGRKRLLAKADCPAALGLLKAIQPRGLVERIEREAGPLLETGVAPEPLVSGDDLIAAGYKPGPHFGRMLEKAYDAQLEGAVTTRQQALDWLKEQYSADPAEAEQ